MNAYANPLIWAVRTFLLSPRRRLMRPHSMHIPALSEATGKGKHQLIVKEKLFSSSGDSFLIKTLNGQLFGNGIQTKGKSWAMQDQMTLLDGNGQPIAVCRRVSQEIFKIYTLHRVHPSQAQSENCYEGKPLYTYAEVIRAPFTTIQEVKFVGDGTTNGRAVMTIERTGSMPLKRTVFYRGRPAAIMEGGTWNGNCNSYKITVCPGIDPCLMVCLTAICDEMDEKR